METLQKKTRWINIDESWLGMEDFRRMKWRVPESTNSIAKNLWQPRISLLLAIDNEGESYFAVSQENTNQTTMQLFLNGLIQKIS